MAITADMIRDYLNYEEYQELLYNIAVDLPAAVDHPDYRDNIEMILEYHLGADKLEELIIKEFSVNYDPDDLIEYYS